ncbi:nucleotidyltransferase domain-containing protein [Halobacillus salinus]|uniref:Nucleotidyltransferase domain-containing protein n=1 Tax=Halobacillus salinus TaxID=192814 RepID=A0A4Z0H386_9BACI|nr:nucleotidyltransferase domain-containing protein [Halobacillus salinus]TGB03881.1 nucleotidyltransferase domain-containing protein [Halobacillus salinus]
MRQWDAVQTITASLENDPLVKAVFLKGSMGRGEEDEHSDVDLYCLVEEEDRDAFLTHRKEHLESYQSLLFYDDIFIIAPQIIAIYENLLHVDLFTVTEGSLVHKDYFRVLYDPENRMEKYRRHQTLVLSDKEFQDAADDVAFYLLQYKKAAGRGNEIWAVKVLEDCLNELGRVLLQKYQPNRAQLGLKAASTQLPDEVFSQIEMISNRLNGDTHAEAARLLSAIVREHLDWLEQELPTSAYTYPFIERMVKEITPQK